jgi:GH25 family lysozyme M1 (1,4-beta-N-acetylmuramidase)
VPTSRSVGIALATVSAGVLIIGLAAPSQASPGKSPTGGGTAVAANAAGDAAGKAVSAVQPIASARAAGITAPGQAYMGWNNRPATTSGTTKPTTVEPLAASVAGMDVASHQRNVNWSYWWGKGKRFAYVKATEGTGYRNPYFTQQYNGSYRVGMIRGAYHFALPNRSSGATQANYFVSRGGGWSRDGKTLPGALDIEYNPYGSTCYGLSKSAMVSWIRGFAKQYKARTGRDVVIYSTTDWWKRCTGNSSAFGKTNPLWIARYSSSPGTLPAGWGFHTFWQHTSSPLDQNRFNGSMTRLRVLAKG